MLQKILVALGLGIMWLFIFSIPVDRERKIFDVSYNALVNTKPMHWVVNKLQSYVDETRDLSDSGFARAKERLSSITEGQQNKP